jgi:UDPglucose--hexose-1-phosphate uridylyltransferase
VSGRPAAPVLLSQPHRRFDALSGEWLLVSSERTSRPWLGIEERPPAGALPTYEPSCYLCPGNTRANGQRNPDYESTFVFTNDFAALRPDSPAASYKDGLLWAESERGRCLVICFSPRHDLTISHMNAAQARVVVDLWATQSAELGKSFEWVQVFENRGSAMGASNPHPHGQIWAGSALPREAEKENATQRRHFEATGHSLLLDYAEQEVGGPRDLGSDDDWLIVVPFWAAWPFETLVIPRKPVSRLPDLDDHQRDSLSDRLTRLLRGYDGVDRPYWQLHAHFYPPLLQATVRKFMVGYELLSEPQRDITAEDAAERLRTVISLASAGADLPGGR